jgi:hypothetical protein
MDWTWFNKLASPEQQILVNAAGDLAAAIAVGLFNLARQRIAASLRGDPHEAAIQQAIQSALRDALVRSVAGLTDNRAHFEHLLKTVFAPWLARPAVQAELQKVLAAGPETHLDMALLQSEFAALDFERDALPAPLADVVYQLATAFGAAAVWQGELQPVVLTNSVARIEAQLRTLAPLDLDVTLREHYLNGVLDDCDRLLLMDSDTEEGRRPPRLQRVFVDLRIDQQPTLDQFFFRLGIEQWQDDLAREVLQGWLQRHSAERNRRMAWRETQQDGDNWLEHLRSLDEEETGNLAQALAVQSDDLAAAVQPLTPLEALLAQPRPQMVLLGDPGSGKSTITRRIAAVLAALGHGDAAAQLDADEQAWAHQLLSAFGRWLLPVRVVMSRWAQEHRNSSGCAADVIAECIRLVAETTPAARDRLAETINERFNGRQPTIFVLLDGLDEVTDDAKSWLLLDAVADFHTKYPLVPLLITCRSRPYAALQARTKAEGRRWPKLPLRTLQPLPRAAIDRFLDRWHAEMADARHYERVEAGHARAKIAAELDRPERRELRKMAETPLLLTMMVIVNYKQRLPDSRIELYEQLVKQLLYEWERTKQEIRGQKTSLERYLQEADAKVDELGEQLNQLAFTIHDPAAGADGGDTVDIPLARLADALRPLYPQPSNASQRAEAEAWLADVLTLITGRSGLLSEVDKGIFRFTHRTFQEYLAARWIAAGTEEISDGDGKAKSDYIDYRVIAEHVDDPNWREAILLTIGYQSLLQANAFDRTANILHGLWPDDLLTQSQRALLLGEAFVHLFGLKRLGKVKNKRIAAELAVRVPRDLSTIMQSSAPPARIRLEAGLLLADLGVLPDGLDDFMQYRKSCYGI